MGAERQIRISTPKLVGSHGAWRVEADVDGTPVWFESRDFELSPSPESFASAFLLPALARRARLVSEAPLDPVWMKGMDELLRIFQRWWRYPRFVPQSGAVASALHAAQAPNPAPAPDSVAAPPRSLGLFFSGGVDSFHTLLCSGEPIELLVSVQGFDIALDDTRRAEAAEASLRAIASAAGTGSAWVRTNLRQHPLIQAVPWERAHGGALIAVGHLLAARVREILISSSITTIHDKPWGTHWTTDPLYSSSRVRFRESGQEMRRIDKLRTIAGNPLPQQHLRVCWMSLGDSGNCSKCGKCLITRLVLEESGMLERFPVFLGSASLLADVDALRSDPAHRQSLTDMAESPHQKPDLKAATARLLARSRHAKSWPVRARRSLLQFVTGWTRPRS
jgi:hypothetical protein